MKDQVQKEIDTIRPNLQADGGNVELIDVSEEGIVTVKLMRTCHGCPIGRGGRGRAKLS